MFFKLPEDPHYSRVIKFYCGTTCLYFPPLTIVILCTNLMYLSGSFSFLPILGLISLSEILKYIFISTHYKSTDKHCTRGPQKSSLNAVKKWISEKKLKDIAKSVFLMGLVLISYFVIAILFGAELLQKNEETLMLSLLLTVLTALPPCLYSGPNFAIAIILGDEKSSLNPLSIVFQHIVRVTLLGAWLGAFVIPLDWDRLWQEWPVPCCVGALMGYVAAHATAMIQAAIPRSLTSKLS